MTTTFSDAGLARVLEAVKKETTHTPGPWARDKYGHIVDEQGKDVLFRSVSVLASGDPTQMDEAERNTTLAAAAPDLLEVLQALAERSTHRGQLMLQAEDVLMIRAAIAKATGEQS
ncbi:hypothetical protein K6V92_10440 [Cupriavidus respiraculi]|uniref:hypothetical protein n=1 Tax=Cupriavidus respiraculi TaxID=195930 RepID=UPI001C98CA88|nr:hypothetical protein [Cupriavidus respiraculi]MBY4947036.1 hypothetical protein [Cupriavidus respiraculi]